MAEISNGIQNWIYEQQELNKYSLGNMIHKQIANTSEIFGMNNYKTNRIKIVSHEYANNYSQYSPLFRPKIIKCYN